MADTGRDSDGPRMPGSVRKGPGQTTPEPTAPAEGASGGESTAKTGPPVTDSPPRTAPAEKTGGGDPAGERTPTRDSGSASGASASDPSASDPLRGSRTSGVWIGLVALGVLLVLLVIFITQNTQQAQVQFLSWEGTAPQAALLLAAAVAGLFLTVIAGSMRILQLRRRVKQVKKQEKKQQKRARKAAKAAAKG